MTMISRKSLLYALITSILCAGCIVMPEKRDQVQFGVSDEGAGKQIDRINTLSSLRAAHRYTDITARLINDLKMFSGDSYARSRINNELAEIYSSEWIDLESAIAHDESILRESIPQDDTLGDFVPKFSVASQRVISDSKYVKNYILTSSFDISTRAKERLATNRLLLSGQRPGFKKNYDIVFLKKHIDVVRRDVLSTHPGTLDRYKILSRLIKAEYEIKLLDKNFDIAAYKYIINGQFPPEQIDFSEIDFLSFAKYLQLGFEVSGDLRLAEASLQVIFRPYANLRSANYRWLYNKLVNDYINVLIEANAKRGQYDELLYYTSLNKSRMLLEERLAFAAEASGAAKVNDLTIGDGIQRTATGLPDKAWFKTRLASTDAYLDFYVGGKFVAQASANSGGGVRNSSFMPLITRDFGAEEISGKSETFIDDVLYVTHVSNGKVLSVRKLTGAKLAEVKGQLDASYLRVSDLRQGGDGQPVRFFQNLRRESKLPASLTVSPDKWLAKHPLDMHLDAKITRSVNFFTAGSSDRLDNVRLVGFFNPTSDLPGAEQEADSILSQLPEAQVFKREAARVEALQAVGNANVIHLSMHGAFNAHDPKNSKLYFSGAQRGLSNNDPNAVYARDMASYPALRDRDLIFAAACQTGLSTADQANENELMGILRPLTANRNKNIILSLWKVDDAATKDFVAAFYQRLASSKNVVESFHFAQETVRAKYKQPYYWAAFYLSQSM